MNTDTKIKVLNQLKSFISNIEKDDAYKQALPKLKLNSIVNYYIYKAEIFDDYDLEILNSIIILCQKIYNNMDIESPISDELYDRLYELNKDKNNMDIIGADLSQVSDKKIVKHNYPDLRGTLNKIHYVNTEDNVTNDSRKSLEQWLTFIENKLGRPLTDDEAMATFEHKWDGISVVMECNKNGIVERALSRGDTSKNEAIDLSQFFKGIDLSFAKPEYITKEFGVKTEVVIKYDDLEELNTIVDEPFNNVRSAASSILNSKDSDKNLIKYLTVIPLAVQDSVSNAIFPPIDNGIIDTELPRCTLNDLGLVEDILEEINTESNVKIDGCVITLINEDIQKIIGRENNINLFQIAYKYPPEQKKTTLLDVEFSIGLLGAVTPVAKIKPVIMNGNVIKSCSLGSIDRFESLQLKYLDEVIIKYEIIPYLDIDDTCSRGVKEIYVPTNCPKCNHTLVEEPVLKCINYNCPSLVVGKILNYIKKNAIPYLDIGKIQYLYKQGYLKGIDDLYRLKNYRNELIKLPKFGEVSVDKILSGIQARYDIYDYELLGSIGIASIGRKIFKRISIIYNIDELIEISINNDSEKLMKVGGIQKVTADKIIQGIRWNKDLIQFLRSELNIKRDERKFTVKVAFSKIRDEEFKKFLEFNNVMVMDSYNKETNILIVPDTNVTSSKIEKAKKNNCEIISIEDAYQLFKFK